MSITIEFFGIPQLRAGTKGLDIEAGTFGQALAVLSERFPLLAEDCFEVCDGASDGTSRLRAACVANFI